MKVLETIALLDATDWKNFLRRVDLTIDCKAEESIFCIVKIMDGATVIVFCCVSLNTNQSWFVVLEVFIEWNEELAFICSGVI